MLKLIVTITQKKVVSFKANLFSLGLPIFKNAKAHCAKIKELDLASLGTQTASIFNAPFR